MQNKKRWKQSFLKEKKKQKNMTVVYWTQCFSKLNVIHFGFRSPRTPPCTANFLLGEGRIYYTGPLFGVTVYRMPLVMYTIAACDPATVCRCWPPPCLGRSSPAQPSHCSRGRISQLWIITSGLEKYHFMQYFLLSEEVCLNIYLSLENTRVVPCWQVPWLSYLFPGFSTF